VHGTPLEAIGDMTGTLMISKGAASLAGTRLALRHPTKPIASAVALLRTKGFRSGDRIRVKGTQGVVGNEEVVFIESVHHHLGKRTHPFKSLLTG